MYVASFERITSMFPFCFKNQSVRCVDRFRRIRDKVIFIAGMKFSSAPCWDRGIWKDCACKDR